MPSTSRGRQNMNYGTILKRAWEITWRYKVLWILGFLSGCGFVNDASAIQASYSLQYESLEGLRYESNYLFAIGLIILGARQVIPLIAQIFLFRGAWIAAQEHELNMASVFEGVLSRLKTGIILIVILVWPFVLTNYFVIPMFANDPENAISLACLVLPIGLVYSIFTTLSFIKVAVEDAGVKDTLGHAWSLFRSNWGNLFILNILLGVIQISIEAIFTRMSRNSQGLFNPLLILLFILDAILTTYVYLAWILAYQELISPTIQSSDQPLVKSAHSLD
jgi:hypothetical protein